MVEIQKEKKDETWNNATTRTEHDKKKNVNQNENREWRNRDKRVGKGEN